MSVWYRFVDWVDSPWKFLLLLWGGACAIGAIVSVWGSRRPVGDFFEEFIARALSIGLPLAIFGVSIAVGIWGFNKSASRLLATLLGIATFVVSGTAGYLSISRIPGVNWRFERLQDERLQEAY